jgi:hypothetical protein
MCYSGQIRLRHPCFSYNSDYWFSKARSLGKVWSVTTAPYGIRDTKLRVTVVLLKSRPVVLGRRTHLSCQTLDTETEDKLHQILRLNEGENKAASNSVLKNSMVLPSSNRMARHNYLIPTYSAFCVPSAQTASWSRQV